MVIDFTLLGNPLYVDQPQDSIGWIGWIIVLSSVLLLLYQWRGLNKRWTRLHGGIFTALAILLILTNLFFILQVPAFEDLLVQNGTLQATGATVPIFAALAWVLAAGLLGVFPAVGFGIISGGLICLWGTHNPFTPLEYSLLALFLAAAFHQRYRTWVFRLLRHPLFTTLLFAFVYPLLFLIDTTLMAQGSLAVRLDVALSQVEGASIALGAQLVVAGLIAEAVRVIFPRLWGFSGPLEPSPVERRLQSRVL
jgi:hypothetical protein